MDGFQVYLGKMREAADAVGRNSGHLGDMADYCESLSSSSDGAEFGEVLARLRDGYDAAAETQVTVLKDMKEKLGRTRDALEATMVTYETTDSTLAIRFDAVTEEIDKLATDSAETKDALR